MIRKKRSPKEHKSYQICQLASQILHELQSSHHRWNHTYTSSEFKMAHVKMAAAHHTTLTRKATRDSKEHRRCKKHTKSKEQFFFFFLVRLRPNRQFERLIFALPNSHPCPRSKNFSLTSAFPPGRGTVGPRRCTPAPLECHPPQRSARCVCCARFQLGSAICSPILATVRIPVY